MFRAISTLVTKLRNAIGALPAIRSHYIVSDRQFHLLREYLWMSSLRSDPRHSNHYSVTSRGFKVYSQNDEDGILEAIFSRIGDGERRFVEIGVGNGLENNTVYLLQKGWSGVWIDADVDNAAQITKDFSPIIDAKKLCFRNVFVTAEAFQDLLRDCGTGDNLDLLSLDIDGNELWLWNSLSSLRPRVVAVEYNAGLGPSLSWAMPYDPHFRNSGTRAHGASLKALEILGRRKGYRLVGCNWTGVNAFFVREDLAGDLFEADGSSERHYEPPRYYCGPFFGGYQVDPAELNQETRFQ